MSYFYINCRLRADIFSTEDNIPFVEEWSHFLPSQNAVQSLLFELLPYGIFEDHFVLQVGIICL